MYSHGDKMVLKGRRGWGHLPWEADQCCMAVVPPWGYTCCQLYCLWLLYDWGVLINWAMCREESVKGHGLIGVSCFWRARLAFSLHLLCPWPGYITYGPHLEPFWELSWLDSRLLKDIMAVWGKEALSTDGQMKNGTAAVIFSTSGPSDSPLPQWLVSLWIRQQLHLKCQTPPTIALGPTFI